MEKTATVYACDVCGAFISYTDEHWGSHAVSLYSGKNPSVTAGVCANCGILLCVKHVYREYVKTTSWDYNSYYFGDTRTGHAHLYKILCARCQYEGKILCKGWPRSHRCKHSDGTTGECLLNAHKCVDQQRAGWLAKTK